MNDSPALQFFAGAMGALLVVAGVFFLRRRRERGAEKPTDPYVEGLKFLIDGKKGEAFARLQQAVAGGSAPMDAYIRIGKMLREGGDGAKALQVHKSLTITANLTRQERIDVYANVAEDYVTLGRTDKALEVIETAMRRLNLRDPSLTGIAARVCHALGRTEEAYEYMKELKKAGTVGDRELALYLATVAEKELENGRSRDARKTLQRALRHDTDCAPALVALGRLEEEADDVDDAIRWWRQAARLSPELSPAVLRNLERVLYQRGTFSEIEAVYRDVLEHRPSDEYAALSLASFYRKLGRTGDAVSLLEDYRSAHPDSVAGTLLLTSLYAARGDSAELETFLEESEHLFGGGEHYNCGHCGLESDVMRWHCPRCNRFDSFSRNSA